MQLIDLNDQLVKVILTGRLDTPGVARIETRFTAALVPDAKSAIVDLSGVEYVTSMGLRLLVSTTRHLAMRNAKLVLFAPHPRVNEVFDTASLRDLIPVCDDEASARMAVAV